MNPLTITLSHYLVVSGIVFGLGIAIALSKRNAIAVLMGIELMPTQPLVGHVFVVFVLTVAAAEAAVALAMAVLVYRRRETVDLDRINLMRW
jgi:NADH:ubiquinone oxidoreductase subunit K